LRVAATPTLTAGSEFEVRPELSAIERCPDRNIAPRLPACPDEIFRSVAAARSAFA
jgi:hypothetical protein